MSQWTVDDAVPGVSVRRSSRRLSVAPGDLDSATTTGGSSALSTPSKPTPRKLMHPKSSMIPRLKDISEKMASSDDEVIFVPTTEQKKGRGRPKKEPATPPRTKKMTATSTPASTMTAVATATATPSPSPAKKEKTPPRSRSSSRTRKAAPSAVSTATSSPAKLPTSKIPALNLDDDLDSPAVVTRRSTRLAAIKTPGHANGRANGLLNGNAAVNVTPSVPRESTEQWRVQFTEKHPVLTKIVIPGLICLVYAAIIIGVCYYFDVQKKAPIWADAVAKAVNDAYDEAKAKWVEATVEAMEPQQLQEEQRSRRSKRREEIKDQPTPTLL